MRKTCFYFILIVLTLTSSLPVYAAWEIGGRAGYDSNVNRTVDDPESDTYLGAYLLYNRGVSGETRLDWTVAASVEGNEYLKNNDLSNACVTLAPGLVFFPYLTWSINVFPFVQGKIFSDNDQSALAFGAKINLKQPLGKYFYLGEYYIYSDSRAENDIYSSVENATGVVIGVNWTSSFFTEIGYEFSAGDSFRSIETNSTTSSATNGWGRGRGKQHGYSSTFATEVYKDNIQRHSIGFTLGAELFPSVFSTVSYTYSAISGDLGDSENHTGLVGISYRF